MVPSHAPQFPSNPSAAPSASPFSLRPPFTHVPTPVDYWVQHPDEATITIRPAYHIGYGKEIGCGNVAVLAGSYRVAGMNPACDELAAVVRRIHTMVGNANFGNDDNGDNETMYLVFGVGSTELIAASMWALADEDADEPSLVWSRRPYYAGYEGPASYFDSKSPR